MIFEGDVTPQQILEQVGGYQAFLPEDAVIDHEGKPTPLRDMPDIKNAKDLAALAKGYVESQREIGRRERVPGKDAKPEELQAFRARLVERGVLPTPVASPQDYGIARPETVPEALWNPELADSLASILHKHGIPKEAAPELLALHEQAITGSQNMLKTSEEQGMAALKAEHGEKFEERFEMAKRFVGMIFKTPEEVAFADVTGLSNSPLFLGPLLRLAPYAQQDSSFLQEIGRPSGGMSTEEAVKEHTRVQTDPTHPQYEGYRKGDPKALAYVDSLYRQSA